MIEKERGQADEGVALALGSSFLGVYAHGGFLRGLNDAGIFPGHVAGSSAGALAGGFYASGLRGKELEAEVLSPILKRKYPDWLMPVRSFPQMLGKLSGIMGGEKVVKHLREVLPVSDIAETPGVRLSLSVTDYRKQEGVFLTEGPLAEAMMASCAVPVLFSGQILNGTEYHDGGVIHEIPIEPFISDPEIHTIIAHKIVHERDKPGKRLAVKDPFVNGYHMLNDTLFEFRKQAAERNGKRVIVMETQSKHPGLFQTKAAKKAFYDLGYRTADTISEFLGK
ncbi:MAG: patatin-like phospholipase family protein [Akkermansiaceae bacterium]|nr:patatin-like phospholipase family protein [Akkermansiaceae bacterium]